MSLHADKNVGTYLDRTLKVVKQHYLRAFRAAGADISTEQWVLIDQLYNENGLSQTDLANGSYKNAPTVSRIIDLLCDKGFVERQRFEGDRRRYKIYLTKSGRQLHQKLMPRVLELRQQTWQGLSDEDWEKLKIILGKVLENFTPEPEEAN
ncbi:MAG: MarR family transcriptional regulator [Bacteroidota bacterium]